MSLVDGPAGKELAREELSDPVYANAQPTLLERVLNWITEQFDTWLTLAGEVPGGQWLLAAVAAAVVGLGAWLAARWYLAPPAKDRKVFEGTGRSLASDFRSEADQHFRSREWRDALVSATRAIVSDLQEQAVVPIGPGVTISEVSESVPDLAVQRILTVFEEVQYGGRECTADQAQSALRLARVESRTAQAQR